MNKLRATQRIVAVVIAIVTVGMLYAIAMVPTDDGPEPATIDYFTGSGGCLTIEYTEQDIIKYPVGHFRECSMVLTGYLLYTPTDPVVKKLYSNLEPIIGGMTDREKADYLCGFVKRAITYTSDEESHGCRNYVQYASETILTGKGDCEDQSLLLYHLYRLAGLECRLASCSIHSFLLVWLDGEWVYSDPTNYSETGKAYIVGDFIHFEPIISVVALLIYFGTLLFAISIIIKIRV